MRRGSGAAAVMLPRMRKLKPRLTYANVAATLALVLSMSGGALAASKYVINSKKQINPKVLKALKGTQGTRGGAGATGATGPQGKEGPGGSQGPEGKQGPQGEAGTALAYAHITLFGELDEANSKNFKGATVTNPLDGAYCISGLGFTPHNVVATVNTSESLESFPGVTATLGPYGVCTGKATQITVETFEAENEEGIGAIEAFTNLGVFLSVN